MRRKDREVTDFDEIIKIVDACQIVRLGLADGDFPYIVPVNFAYQVQDGTLYLYIHGAMAGRK
ncbi:MAG: pyridoxamine 5'-phosphate oxidase family protein, partial [Lachnospiraceae bacterium]|nr:pyridoxamine 5'-phosphate oxidase family protein [Lachnospiraceae bacterium]